VTRPSVIVLGAAGFIGRHAAQALSNYGCNVLGLGHGDWKESEWNQWGINRWIDADIGVEALNELVQDETPRCVMHCGGSSAVSVSYAQPLQDFQRATLSTAIVLDWIRLNCASSCRFVLVSSAAVYGDQGDSNATESSVRSPISPYGVHKVAAEALCESYSRFFGVPSSIVRLFSVYGEGLRKQLLWDALNKLRAGQNQFFGTGNELRDWVHVSDASVLLAMAGLSAQPTFEVYNGGFEHASTREILSQLAAAYGHTDAVVFNGETHKGNPRRLTSECGHARQLLNWQPTIRLNEGLRRYADWFKRQADVAS
jgi:UDP-glucose 4-epimerase